MSLPALKTNPKIILFTDWDGTVTLQDSNDYLTDNFGMGVANRRALNEDVLAGRKNFREIFEEMLDSVNVPFDKCIEILLENIELDPGFADFYAWSKSQNIPVVVVSSGMIPIIRALLTKLVGESAAQEIQIIANNVNIKPDGSWHIIYRDESPHGHDKSRAIRPYADLEDRPVLLYAGDGVSDLSAASETDLLFAKEGRDLITWCKKENIPYHEFSSYQDIHKLTAKLNSGEVTISDLRE